MLLCDMKFARMMFSWSRMGWVVSRVMGHLNRHSEDIGPLFLMDNNICERILKRYILHQKNSLFYKTEYGAYIGDMFMSLIHICNLMRVNPFDYLVTLIRNSSALFKDPSKWLPWNYKTNEP